MFPVTGLASDGEDSAPLRSPCGPAPPATLCPSLVVLVDASCERDVVVPQPDPVEASCPADTTP